MTNLHSLFNVSFMLTSIGVVFYTRMVLVSLIFLIVLAWVGYDHDNPAMSVGDEVLSFVCSFALAMVAVFGMWTVALRREADALFLVRDSITIRNGIRVLLALMVVTGVYLLTEGTGYARSNVHRLAALASVIVLLYFAYVYDLNIGAMYAHHGAYRIFEGGEASHHLWYLIACTLVVLVDVALRQCLFENVILLSACAVFMVTRAFPIGKLQINDGGVNSSSKKSQ